MSRHAGTENQPPLRGVKPEDILKAFVDARFCRIETSQISDDISELSNDECLRDYMYILGCIVYAKPDFYWAADYTVNIVYSAWASRCQFLNIKAMRRPQSVELTAVESTLFLCPDLLD